MCPHEIWEGKKNRLVDIFRKDFPERATEIVDKLLISLFPNNPNELRDKDCFLSQTQKPSSSEEADDFSSLLLLNDDNFGYLLGELDENQKSIFSFFDELYEEEYSENLELTESLEATVEKFLSDKNAVSSSPDKLKFVKSRRRSLLKRLLSEKKHTIGSIIEHLKK